MSLVELFRNQGSAIINPLETLRALKSMNAAAPCILITANPSEQLRIDADEADAFSVLKKPVSRRDLVITVSTALANAYDDPDTGTQLIG